jgi:MFS family permease
VVGRLYIVTGAEAAVVKAGQAFAGWGVRRLLGWLRPDTSPAVLAAVSDELAVKVAEREAALFAQLGGGPDMVIDELQFHADPGPRLAADDEDGVLKDVGEYFRRQEGRRMVVLGAPGAGKTVMLVRLVLDQLQYRRKLTAEVRGAEPVPVRLNAAGWDGSTDFNSWLSLQLAVDYGLNRRVARKMVDTGRILPVLDGIDELDAPHAEPLLGRAALDRLNKRPWRDLRVVVACRSGAYRNICELGDSGTGLEYPTTVTVQPLEKFDVYCYLEKYRDVYNRAEAEWAPVIDQLDQPESVLTRALSTPWLLSLVPLALKRGRYEAAVALAACRDIGEIHDLLFASLIPAAVEAIPETDSATQYSEKDVQRWLRTLAQHLERQRDQHYGGAQIALDQVWQLAGSRVCRALYAAGCGFSIALAFALMTLFRPKNASSAAINFSKAAASHGPVASFIFSTNAATAVLSVVLIGFLCGLLYWTGIGDVVSHRGSSTKSSDWGDWRSNNVGPWLGPRRFAWRVPRRSGAPRWHRGLGHGLSVGLGFGIVAGLVWAFASHTGRWWLTLVLVIALSISLAFGLLWGFGATSDECLALGQDAERVIHDDLVAGLVYGLFLFVIAVAAVDPFLLLMLQAYPAGCTRLLGGVLSLSGLCPGHPSLVSILTNWRSWLGPWLATGFVLTLFVVPFSAVTTGLHATASMLFGFTRVFPRRPARFLEWARHAGLLRVTGIAYQFRHDTYQQWLASTDLHDVSMAPYPPHGEVSDEPHANLSET